jgi:hypothetical protein
MLFFLIERTGPPGGGTARYILPVRCPHPSHSWLGPTGRSLHQRSWLYNQSLIELRSLCVFTRVVIRSSWNTRPRWLWARRLPARHAHTCHAPSGFAAGASRHSTRTDRRPCLSLRLSLSIASHPRVGSGNVSRPPLRVGPAIPPQSPTTAHGSHCPPIGRCATSAFGASACGEAPSARGFAASVSRPIYRVPCRVYIPLSTFPILLICDWGILSSSRASVTPMHPLHLCQKGFCIRRQKRLDIGVVK